LPTEARPRDLPLALLAAFACGALVATQSRINGRLSEAVGSFPAAWFSFGSGLMLLTLCWVLPRYREHLARVPRALREGRLAWWQVLGGVGGGLLVGTQTYAVPLVGVAAFLIATIGGQTVSALLVDRWGLGSAPAQLLSPTRLAAAALAVAGVAIAATAGSDGARFLALPVALAFLVGMGAAVQQAVNGRVTTVTRDPVATAWINFVVGTTALVLIGAVTVVRVGLPTSWAAPWWAWCGGLCGVGFIALAAWAVQHSGVLLFGLVTITSQMLLALLLDLAGPATRDLVGPQMLTGVGITIVAACWAAIAARRAGRTVLPSGA
jgi:transporter family-2 protein